MWVTSKRLGLGQILLLVFCAEGGVVMICLVCVKHSHASFLLELPAPPAAKRGPRVLFDPVFSEHCADRAAALASFYKTRRRTGLVGLLPLTTTAN